MRKRIRVAMGTVYPYDETHVRGGVEAVALCLVSALAERESIDLHVVSCSHAVKSSFTQYRHSATFHWIATGKKLGALRAATWDALQVRKVYEEIHPDIVHAQNGSSYGIGAPSGTPMVLTIHGVEAFVPQTGTLRHYRGPVGLYRRVAESWAVEQSISRASALVSIAGNYVPQVIGDGRLGGKPVFGIANPVPDGFWATDPSDCGSGLRVLCVGQIVQLKNASGLVRAFAEVVNRVPDALLQFAGGIGEPRYYMRVQQEISRLGLERNVQFLGRLNQSQLVCAYAQSSVVASASIQESAPMALAQAMAAARPVVATRVGGVPWMVADGRTGYVVDTEDHIGLGNRLTELLLDRPKCVHMGRLAREEATLRFSSKTIARDTEELYRKILDGFAVGVRA